MNWCFIDKWKNNNALRRPVGNIDMYYAQWFIDHLCFYAIFYVLRKMGKFPVK
jgi:hypothetical protein